jgi:pimeloyl-ACP methyl ester carboxylesterase
MRDGARLNYLDIGRGAPMVLLHGFGMTGAMWLPFVLPLARRHRFILPDLRGFGGSHQLRFSQPDLLTQHAHDLEDLLRGLDLEDVHLGGLSMGACTALQYQRLFGFGRIRAYANMDQAPCIRSDADWPWGLMGERHEARMASGRRVMEACAGVDPDQPFAKLPRAVRRGLEQESADFLRDAFHNPLLRHGAAALVGRLLYGRLPWAVPSWRVTLEAVRSYTETDYDFRPSMRNIRIPMSIFVGMASTMYPPEGQLRIADYVPQAQIVPFENCGHAFPFEAPRRFVRALKQFLATA